MLCVSAITDFLPSLHRWGIDLMTTQPTGERAGHYTGAALYSMDYESASTTRILSHLGIEPG